MIAIKKKKILYIILLIILVVIILFLYQIFNGNPVSKHYLKAGLEDFLEEEFPDSEYRINGDGVYDFTFGMYGFDVTEFRGDDEIEYVFEVWGAVKPTDIHYYPVNTDYELGAKFGKEIKEQLYEGIDSEIPGIVTQIEFYLDVLEEKYPPDTKWSHDIELIEPFDINFSLDVTNLSKEQTLEVVQVIQKTLNNGKYPYNDAKIEGFVYAKGSKDYAKYTVNFDKDTDISLRVINEHSK
ncbi:hypothetical protein [Lederbergia graminis]|uniref:Uncharacterized protein n=1 Tax=Lederbergia graminis TaxID=735518 RepID=A0ABW0LPV4_9BACI